MTKLSLQVNDEIVSWEIPDDDLNTLQLADGFYHILLGHTFHSESIIRGMLKFVDREKDCSFEELLRNAKL